MSRASEPLTVALLAVPATTAATLYGFYDSLASLHRDWGMLTPVPYRQRFDRLTRELQDLASPTR